MSARNLSLMITEKLLQLTQCPYNLFIAALWFQIQHSQHWAQHRHRFLNRDSWSPAYCAKRSKKLLWKARQWSWQRLFRDQLCCQKTELSSFRIQVSSSFLFYFNPVSLTKYKQLPCQASRFTSVILCSPVLRPRPEDSSEFKASQACSVRLCLNTSLRISPLHSA